MDYGYRPVAPKSGQALASAFLHADFLHLAANMYFLWAFGRAVEQSLGAAKFLLVYFLTHAFAVLAHSMANPRDFTVLIGASGAISGVMGVYAFLFATRPVTLRLFVGLMPVAKMAMPALAVVLLWFSMDLLFALLPRDSSVGGTAYWAHLGGGLIGFILGMLFDGLGHGSNRRLS